MKIMAYCILHYGREWLSWAIRSVIPYVDEFHIFYTPFPSHGHATTLINPESKVLIGMQIAPILASNGNVFWHDCGRFAHEGEHRTFAANYCQKHGADIILVVDADELWVPDVLDKALQFVKGTNGIHSFRIGMRHFWRSVYWVCDDPAMPTRIILPNIKNNTEEYLGETIGKVFHMGYAQSPRIIEYKQSIHGHKNEWRAGWFENTFKPWSPDNPFNDVHPTCVDFWTPKNINIEEPATDYKILRNLIVDHPYWKTGLITNESFGD